MGKKKERKFNPRPVIEYPPVPTRKWVPPDLRPKKKRKPAYVKPPGISQKLAISTLGRVWHNFRVCDERVFLLGSFSQTHKRFCYLSNGYQSPCNCVIAILFSKVFEMAKWTTELIDETLDVGNQLYFLTANKLDDRKRTYIDLSEVLTTFYFGRNKITMDTDGQIYSGNLFEDFRDSPFLINVIQDFFNDKHEAGVITSQRKYFAFWPAGKYYFLFDPAAHDELAYHWKGYLGFGYAMVMRFKNTADLVAAIHENVDKSTNSKFQITAIRVVKMVTIDATPPTNEILKTHCALPKIEVEKFEPVVEKPPMPIVEDVEKEMAIVDLHEDEPSEEIDPYTAADEVSPEAALAESLTDSQKAAGVQSPVVTERKEVSKSKFPIEHAKAESVTYFTTLVFDKMGILRASTHQADVRFSKYKGEQSVANAVAAIAMLRIHKSKQWIHRILDEVLLAAEQIHANILKQLPRGDKIKMCNVPKQVLIGEQSFEPEIAEYTTIGRLLSLDEDVLDLLPALQEFFRNNDACVITGPLTLAVWYEDGFYYMFDPNERDEIGAVILKSAQVGSDIRVLEFTPGTACVTWYKELKDLVRLYMNNVNRIYRRDVFVLSRVQINDIPDVQEPWHNFQGTAIGKWILRGTFNQNDRRFEKENRNKQATAMSGLCLAYAMQKHVREFDRSDVDEIVLQGDTLYSISVIDLKQEDKFQDPFISTGELRRKFPLEGKQIILDIEECMINGLLDAKDDNDALNLKKGFYEFFDGNDTCILTTRSISVAVWKTDGIYYYFDSHSCDDKGVTSNFGTSCIIRVLTIEDLTKTIEANLLPGTSNVFNINRINVKILELSDTGLVRPPLNNYVAINPNVAILRSIMSERAEDFKLNKGRQTIPMCLVAAGMTKVYHCAIWCTDIIDEILYIGDKLFTETMVDREKNMALLEEEDIDEVYAENCNMDYHIGFNKIHLTYGETLEGNFEDDFVSQLEKFYEGKKESDPSEILVTSDVYTVLVWKDSSYFYLFDPRPRDEGGQVIGKCDWSVLPIASVEEEEGEGGEGEKGYPERYLDFGGGDSADRQTGMLGGGEDEGQERRHSIGYWRKIEEGGKACAMLFLTFELLISHIIENIPPTRRSEIHFKLLPLIIVNKTELKDVFDPTANIPRPDQYAGDWYEFKEIDHGRWILRGSIAYTHEMFPKHNVGRQTIAMCYTTLGYVIRFAISKFKCITLNDILKYGDRLYSATRKIRLKQLQKVKELSLTEEQILNTVDKEHFGLNEIARKFCIGVDEMQVDVIPNTIEGDILADKHEEILDVKRALRLFFEEHRSGILTSKGKSVAIWRGANVYYMFDPSSCGPNGLPCVNGVACITRYLNIDIAAEVFLKHLSTEGKNTFQIHKIKIAIRHCPREPKPEEKEIVEEPQYHGFAPVMPGKYILRGTINQEDPRFARGRNVQSAPIALIALSMTLVHKPYIWTRPIIDDIIILGDELYSATLDTLDFKFNPWEQGMTLHLVNKDYKIGALRANCELRCTDQRGIIDIKHPNVLNLRQGIEKFFEENTHGVIETETLTVAIWQEDDEEIIYMFDPNPRGPAGLPQRGGGGCVLTFETSKLASDHFTSNVDKAKRTGEFVITPVEIVVGNLRTHPKKPKDPCAKKKLSESDLEKRYPPPCEKKRIRKQAEEKRRKKQQEAEAKLGRFKYHDLPNGDAIIRGTKSQTSPIYSELSRGNQDLPNCFAAFVLHRIIPVCDWHHKHIDLILDIGDQLYKDSFITYEPDDPKLGLRNILRKIYIKDVRVTVKVYKPVMNGTLTAYNLEMALINYFQQEYYCILSAKNQHVALFFKTGIYYMFVPHDRDSQGNKCDVGYACVLRFPTIPNLVQAFINNAIGVYDSIGTFSITLLTIGEISRIIPEYAPSKCIC